MKLSRGSRDAMQEVEKSRAKALAELDFALEALLVPPGTQVACLVIAPGFVHTYFGACELTMFDPATGELEDFIEFGWEYTDKGFEDAFKHYSKCTDRLPTDAEFAEMDLWNAEAMCVLQKHELAAPFKLRLVHYTEPRRETLERYGLLRKR